MLVFALYVLAVLGWIVLARADYSIDDTNTTILAYIGPDASLGLSKWEQIDSEHSLSLIMSGDTTANFSVPSSPCFNGTFTYGACRTTDGCSLLIPFIGSGVTLYVLQAGSHGTNVSVVVDDGPPIFNALPPPPPPSYYQTNTPIFDVQSLAFGQHKLTLIVYDYESDLSGMMFDYATINGTLVVNPESTTSAPGFVTSSLLPTSPSATHMTAASTTSISAQVNSQLSSNSYVVPIVATTIAAVLVMALFLTLCIWRRRRSRLHSMSDFRDLESAERGTTISSPFAIRIPAAAVNARPRSASEESILAATISPFPHTAISSPRTRHIGHSPQSSISLASGGPQMHKYSSSTAGLSYTSREMESPVSVDPSSYGVPKNLPGVANLTDKQLDFVATLHRNSVPAATVARLIKRMLADQPPSPAATGQGELQINEPPSYDLHA